MKAIDAAGHKYGKLTGVRRTRVKNYPGGQQRVMWEFKCDCGNVVEKTLFDVRRADTKSCGCARRDPRPLNRLPEGQSSFNTLFASYKTRAIKTGIPWSLDEDLFRSLTKQDCHYCGKPPIQIMLGHKFSFGSYLYNGLDKLTPHNGYVSSNVVPCCIECNWAKGKRTKSEFFEWIAKVYARSRGETP